MFKALQPFFDALIYLVGFIGTMFLILIVLSVVEALCSRINRPGVEDRVSILVSRSHYENFPDDIQALEMHPNKSAPVLFDRSLADTFFKDCKGLNSKRFLKTGIPVRVSMPAEQWRVWRERYEMTRDE